MQQAGARGEHEGAGYNASHGRSGSASRRQRFPVHFCQRGRDLLRNCQDRTSQMAVLPFSHEI